MKKLNILFIVSLLALFVTNSHCQASTEYLEDESGHFAYTENSDGTVSIYGYHGNEETVIVPSEIYGKKVSSVGGIGNPPSDKIKNIIFQDGITDIGSIEFSWCHNLQSITIPNSVLIIKDVPGYFYVTIIANPDSYAREYADEHGIKFSCITHSNIVTDAAIAPTYDREGKTAGSHCSVCGTIITGGQVIPRLQKDVFKPQSPKANIIKNPTVVITFPKKGSTITSSGSSYKVTSTGTNKTVEYSKAPGSKTSLTIPSTVTVDSKKYKVTSIAKNAFKNNKKLKKVTIGSNVTKIGANAFKGCKNLKTITIKSKKITAFGKNTFKGINAKAKIKVPASKYKKYKKLLNGNNSKKKEKYKVL